MIDPRNIEVVDDAVADILRRKTPAERLAMSLNMWRYAKRRLEAYVRFQNPKWDEKTVAREVNRRLSGAA